MGEPIRILNVVGRMDRGGIETLIMNIYRNIDRDKVQFDFLAHYGKHNADYNEEIRALGGRIYEMPVIKTTEKAYYSRIFKYIAALKRFFKEHPEYHVVHGHMTNTASIYMPIARKYGNVGCRIAHSHMAQTQKSVGKFTDVVTDILRKPLKKYVTDQFACSEAAAAWLFSRDDIEGGKVRYVHNAVDTDIFRYDPVKRDNIRSSLGISLQQTVVGHVGRFYHPKNHEFIIEIFEEYKKLDPTSVLLLVGEGELMTSIREQVKEKDLESSVIFTGVRTDVADIMCAMDLFLMPSRYEGLPVVGVEAQANGLPCLFSDAVPDEVDLTGKCLFANLSKPSNQWAEDISLLLQKHAGSDRVATQQDIIDAGYDIKQVAKDMQAFYLTHHYNLEPTSNKP